MNISINTNKEKLDIDLIVKFLNNDSYWAKNRSKATIQKSIENSFCIGVFANDSQIGFARIVTDYSTIYYLADIFILPEFQNKGIGHQLMDYINNLDSIKNLRGILTTRTAHRFYNKFGFNRDNDVVKKRIMVKQP